MIRRALDSDMQRLKDLLSQVLEIHAKIRPDIFVSGTRKYTDGQLQELIHDDTRPIWVWTDETDTVQGYAFCMIKPVNSPSLVPQKSLYIDDLCVDENCRGMHIGSDLFAYVKDKAKEMGCTSVTLNVWEGNDSARKFYEEQGLSPQKTVMELIID